MNNNNDNNNGELSESERQRLAMKAKENYMRSQRFVNVIKDRADKLLKKQQQQQENNNNNNSKNKFMLHEKETKILENAINLGLYEGIAATVVSFAFLRMFPRIVARVITRRNQHKYGGGGGGSSGDGSKYVLDIPPPSSTQQQQSAGGGIGGGIGGKNPFQAGGGTGEVPLIVRLGNTLPMRMFRFFLDGTLSLLVGAQVSYHYSDLNNVMKEFSTVPLLEGRSTISDEFCDDLINEYKYQFKHFGPYDPNDNDNNQNENNMINTVLSDEHGNPAKIDNNLFLKTFMTLSINCMKRREYEKQLREQSSTQHSLGFNEDNNADNYGNNNNEGESISIPPPGVPTDIVIPDLSTTTTNDDQDRSNSSGYNELYFNDGSTKFGEHDNTWLVTDQEEEDQQQNQQGKRR